MLGLQALNSLAPAQLATSDAVGAESMLKSSFTLAKNLHDLYSQVHNHCPRKSRTGYLIMHRCMKISAYLWCLWNRCLSLEILEILLRGLMSIRTASCACTRQWRVALSAMLAMAPQWDGLKTFLSTLLEAHRQYLPYAGPCSCRHIDHY